MSPFRETWSFPHYCPLCGQAGHDKPNREGGVVFADACGGVVVAKDRPAQPDQPAESESLEHARAMNRARQKRYREKLKAEKVTRVTLRSTVTEVGGNVTEGVGGGSSLLSFFQRETEDNTEKTKKVASRSRNAVTPSALRPVTNSTGASEAFLAFWREWPAHPRKCDLEGCRRKWAKRGLDGVAEQVMAGLRAWKGSAEWAKDDGAFIPLPATWLNQRRWEALPKPSADSSGFRPDQLTGSPRLEPL